MRALFFLFLTLLCVKAEEKILSFESEIRVGRDGYLDVKERIRVNVEGEEIQRGIYRDFPQEYRTAWGLKEFRPFEVTGLTRNGLPEPFKVERLGSGTRIRIGSADVLLETGSEQVYEISYRTGGQLLFDKEGDELYWNVTGDFWDFPIVEAKARVVLPEGVAVEEADGFTGYFRSTDRNYEKSLEADGVSYRTTKELWSGQGLTVVVRWKSGALDAAAYEGPGIWKGNELLLMGLMVVAFGLLSFVAMWFEVGRDPARGVVVPVWEPPAGFSPAAARYLWKMKFDDKCFTAGVLSLAAKKALVITDLGYGFHELVDNWRNTDLTEDEKRLYSSLFSGGGTLGLQKTNHERIGGARKKLEKALKESSRGSFFRNNTGHWLTGAGVCLVGLGLMVAAAEHTLGVTAMMVFIGLTALGGAGIVDGMVQGRHSKILYGLLLVPLLGIVIFFLFALRGEAGMLFVVVELAMIAAIPLFKFLIKAPSKAGRQALDVIEGFREYLSVAEEDRLNLENPPEKTPELFEKFLPYALALGVEQQWSEKFDDVLAEAGRAQGTATYCPSFYQGGGAGFQNALSGAAIGAAIGGALASSSVAPSSTRLGGGGGGGSSGGGGGGGGGGGW